MSRIFHAKDANPAALQNKTIAVVGYGNQGRSQALNLRDSGCNVIIGNIDDDYKTRAQTDQFTVMTISQAVAAADVILILLPDEILPEVFKRDFEPSLKAGKCLCFASGYNVTYGMIDCPKDVDLILMAPRMIGPGVRDLFLSRQGFYSFIAIEQDSTGNAREILLALSLGIGTLWKGAVEVSFKIETELDLFNEQAFGPAFGRVLLSSIQTLIEAGYPREAVLLEIYMSGELGYICQTFSEMGLIDQLDAHSQTSQYGAISRGIQFLGVNLKKPMTKILKNITNGKFAKEWSFEQKTGKLRYRFLKAMALRQPIRHWEESVRKQLAGEHDAAPAAASSSH